MSVGHSHVQIDAKRAQRVYRDALCSAPFRTYLFDTKFTVSRDYDIPYLAGYSLDGRTVYIDRGLPVSLRFGGSLVAVLPFIITHERTEKALQDVIGLDYEDAHEVATWCSNLELTKARRSPILYGKALDPFIKADKLVDILRVPSNLDLKPYRDSGDRILLDRMRDKMTGGF